MPYTVRYISCAVLKYNQKYIFQVEDFLPDERDKKLQIPLCSALAAAWL